MLTSRPSEMIDKDVISFVAKQSDFVEKLIPSEMIDKDVISFVATHIERLKECVIPDEFKEKVKHLAETTMAGEEEIGVVCEKMGIEVEKEEEME